MAEIVLDPGSWLNLSNLLEYQGVTFWDQFDYPDIPYDTDDIYVTLTDSQAKRPDLIALDNYGNDQLLWVLLLANDLDLPNQFIEGQTIRVPSQTTIDILLTPTGTT